MTRVLGREKTQKLPHAEVRLLIAFADIVDFAIQARINSRRFILGRHPFLYPILCIDAKKQRNRHYPSILYSRKNFFEHREDNRFSNKQNYLHLTVSNAKMVRYTRYVSGRNWCSFLLLGCH